MTCRGRWQRLRAAAGRVLCARLCACTLRRSCKSLCISVEVDPEECFLQDDCCSRLSLNC